MESINTTIEPNDSRQLPIVLKNPEGDIILMRLNPESDPDSLIERYDMEKISSNDELSLALGKIPEIASAIALSQSFRIVMPAGVLGKLMPLVKDPAMSGLLTTTIVGGKSGQIIGVAGLASMSGFILPVVVWTILSFITGQFFLSQIQKNTRAIFDELRNILFFLVAKEESDLGARIEFLHYVVMNFKALSRNSEMRLTTLVNLQKVNIESLAGLKLWVHNIERELVDIGTAIDSAKENKNRNENIDKVANLVGEIQQHVNRAIASYQCYSLGSTLEIQLGSIFEPSLLEYTNNSLLKQSTGLKSALVKAEIFWNDVKSISYFNESTKFKAGQIQAIGGQLIAFTKKIDDSINATEKYINAIQSLENKGMNLLYHDKAFYRPSQGAIDSTKKADKLLV